MTNQAAGAQAIMIATSNAIVLRFTPSNKIITAEIKPINNAVPKSGSKKMSNMGNKIAPNRGKSDLSV